MKIYTKTGDDGTTALFGGKRVPKDDLRVSAYGEVDELNAALGLVLKSIKDNDNTALLMQIQKDLFAMGACLANPGHKKQKPKAAFSAEKILLLEKAIDACAEELPPVTEFVLPGGSRTASVLDLARTICRRAERSVVSLSRKEEVDPNILVYLNRLSDLLFMLARAENKKAGLPDICWSI